MGQQEFAGLGDLQKCRRVDQRSVDGADAVPVCKFDQTLGAVLAFVHQREAAASEQEPVDVFLGAGEVDGSQRDRAAAGPHRQIGPKGAKMMMGEGMGEQADARHAALGARCVEIQKRQIGIIGRGKFHGLQFLQGFDVAGRRRQVQ